MTWLRHVLCLLLAALLTSSALAQTFQYSRGWTNGKRSGTAACQLQRLRAILEGKAPTADSSYLLCELYRVPEEELRLEHLTKVQPRNPIPEEIVDK